ncbi:MAG: putative rane protein [Glaciihabitans sp.]|jgi:low temperature requirement protein LtrA|nr:putative rane protein [Glaciihabitans sp.]
MTQQPPAGHGHRLRRMVGRDPQDLRRASTPLELLFDLAFVVAFGQAADQFSHLLAADHVTAGLGAFAFAMFAICCAWINFSWFASAFDTDDWFFRVATMVQMVGVVVLALGIPAMFASVEQGDHLDNGVMVAGYVVIRVVLVTLWVRVAVQDPARRRVALTYAGSVTLAQVGWVVLAFARPPLVPVLIAAVILFVIELAGPSVVEARIGGTPWNAGHIAERYGLLAIIALGEVLLGTVTSVAALVNSDGWSVEATLVVVAGVGLTFGLWWSYFILPSAEILARYRRRAVTWGNSHIFIYASIAATGAGLHVASDVIAGHAKIGIVGAVLSIAIPVLVFSIMLFLLYTYLLQMGDPFHIGLFSGTVAVLAGAVVLAALGAPLGISLILITFSPIVIVLGYEIVGHRHTSAALNQVLRD